MIFILVLDKIKSSAGNPPPPSSRVVAGEFSQYDWKDITVSSSGVGSASLSRKSDSPTISFKADNAKCKDTKFTSGTQNGTYSADGKTPLIPEGSSCTLETVKFYKS